MALRQSPIGPVVPEVLPLSASDGLAVEIIALERKNGRLDAEQVVEAARPPGSPLHSYFDWDDKTAAHQQRLEVARCLIRSVRVEIENLERITVAPRYVHDEAKDDNSPGYVSVERLAREPENAKRVLRSEIDRTIGNLGRLATLVGVLGGDSPIDKNEVLRVIKQVKALRAKV